MKSPIKIFILSYNDKDFLKLCIDSILKRTDWPFNIVIVDNASDDHDLINYYKEISKNNFVSVYYNRFNFWILGLNPALKKHLKSNDQYFVVTDGDIVVPMRKYGKCWLTRLIESLDANPVIGKLGVSFDLGYLKSRPVFLSYYEREMSFFSNLKISDQSIAPVDTTLAIYRLNNFIFNFPKFFPGHAILQRPNYYTCRTSADFVCKHLGWRNYLRSDFSQKKKDESKTICFTLMGAYLDETFLNGVSFPYRFFYKSIRPLARIFWSFNVLLSLFYWFLTKLPFKLNELQFSQKHHGKFR